MEKNWANKDAAIAKLTQQPQSMDLDNWTAKEKNAIQEGPPGTELLTGLENVKLKYNQALLDIVQKNEGLQKDLATTWDMLLYVEVMINKVDVEEVANDCNK